MRWVNQWLLRCYFMSYAVQLCSLHQFSWPTWSDWLIVSVEGAELMRWCLDCRRRRMRGRLASVSIDCYLPERRRTVSLSLWIRILRRPQNLPPSVTTFFYFYFFCWLPAPVRLICFRKCSSVCPSVNRTKRKVFKRFSWNLVGLWTTAVLWEGPFQFEVDSYSKWANDGSHFGFCYNIARGALVAT